MLSSPSPFFFTLHQIQNASAEDKQVQYIYKTLGTPKPMDYPDFDLLPLAQYYGRHIVVSVNNCLFLLCRLVCVVCGVFKNIVSDVLFLFGVSTLVHSCD